MGKTILLNLSNINLKGDILDIGESYGVIYSLSKEILDELSIDVIEGKDKKVYEKEKYDTCTMFFSLSSIWREGARTNLIKDTSKLIKEGGEIYIWDINKDFGEIFNNKVMALLPSGKIKEFEFKNLNPVSKSNIDETKEMLKNEYLVVEEKCWENIFFLKAKKI